MLQDAGVSGEQFQQKAQALLNRLSHHPAIPLDEFLLPEGHAILQSYLGSLDSEEGPRKKKPKKAAAPPLWPAKHATWDKKSETEWWQASPFREEGAVMRHPGLRAMCPGQLDMLERLNLKLPEDDPSTVDVNMSLGRARELIKNGSACLPEKSLVYLAHKARLAHGVEHLMMMGALVDDMFGPQGDDIVKVLMEFSSSLLKNLAGNAFDASTYMVAMTVMSVILGELRLIASPECTQQGKRSNIGSFKLMGTGYSDSDESDDDTEDAGAGAALAISSTSATAPTTYGAPNPTAPT